MKIGIALSGGKDSSLAAALLGREGHRVVGYHLLLCPEEYAPFSVDHQLIVVRQICELLGIQLKVIDARTAFRREIMDPFITAYAAGKTPNPCILCNRLLKFGLLLDTALKDGCEMLASGHYARIVRRGRSLLKKPIDPRRDESYFLFQISPGQLSRLCFPLGDRTMEEIGRLAEELLPGFTPLPVSQEACFLSRSSLKRFLRDNLPPIDRPGEIIDAAGKKLGEHPGYHFYTVGQRKGLSSASGKKGPLYVLRLIPEKNQVVVGEKRELACTRFRAVEPNWLSIPPPTGPIQVQAKIRYAHPEAEAMVTPRPNGGVVVEFTAPQEAPTPGQAVVFYQDDTLLGGAWIDEIF
ncbi:MAG: tRNA 2-thiouridine(34) synthase MnmA [Candidatus Euphemobacter frigidus]|nr:tRNA 2-thiouridine(34) synthase MnmA [Candidatus Euphemobacter frigidus]MDP8275299.1 tRNA 2-thiouridine(34) synthase MnmA [Candidatus Euphemobacter frigidus]